MTGFAWKSLETVRRYAELQRRLQAIALGPVESRNFIVELAGQFAAKPDQPHVNRILPGQGLVHVQPHQRGADCCVEINYSVAGHVGVRDSKLGTTSPVLAIPTLQWSPTLNTLQDGTLTA